MRRRKVGGSGGVQPPPPIATKAPTLDVSGLSAAYEWMVVDKHIGFRLAFEWYAENITTLLFRDPLDADRQRSYDRAMKAKALAEGTRIEEEKLHAWTTAMHLFENKVWPNKPLPKVDTAMADTQPSKRVSEVKTVLDSLNGAYGAFGVKFHLTLNAEREAQEQTILIPQAEISAMIRQAPLKTVLSEAIFVAKTISIVRDPVTQEEELNGALFLQRLPELMVAIFDWTQGTSINHLKPVGVGRATAAKTSTTAARTRAPKIANGAADPFGVFKTGTMKAELAAMLYDKQWHTVADMEALCHQRGIDPKWNVPDTFYFLRKKGITVERVGKRVRALG